MEEVGGFHDNEMKWYSEFRGERRSANYFKNIIGGTGKQQYLAVQNIKEGNEFLNIANVKYLLTRDGKGQLVSFENENVLDRITFVPSYRVAEENNIVGMLQRGAYDPSKEIALLEKPNISKAIINDSIKIQNDVNLNWLEYTSNYRKAEIQSPGNGLLRISEVFYPGWEIKVDGKNVKTYRADLSWIAIEITSGKHVIELMPKSLYLGHALIFTYAIGLFLIGFWIFYIIKKRSSK